MAADKLSMSAAKPEVISTLVLNAMLTTFQRLWWGFQGP
jgi:hypothetical protein